MLWWSQGWAWRTQALPELLLCPATVIEILGYSNKTVNYLLKQSVDPGCAQLAYWVWLCHWLIISDFYLMSLPERDFWWWVLDHMLMVSQSVAFKKVAISHQYKKIIFYNIHWPGYSTGYGNSQEMCTYSLLQFVQ